MKITELWLREWINPTTPIEKIADELTMAGLEVDGLHPVAGVFTDVVVAHVERTWPHPQADKLTLCEVNAGAGATYQIVCGAANVRPGLKVALARMHAKLPNDMVIKEVKLRGELSQGMLCSAAELGLSEASDGIMELDADAPLGMPLVQYMRLDDKVLDIALTPNRADCFSVLGVAREIAAKHQLALPQVEATKLIESLQEKLPIQIEAVEACPRYCGRMIRRINPKAVTPLFIRERLRRAGVRIVHPAVDVTNYLMLDLGQPLHAFDLKKIHQGIRVRFGKKGEQLRLLDESIVTLDEKVLVIADEEKPLALAGVMGGLDSGISADTTDIFLEAAFFSPRHLAGIARRFGQSSEAAVRFERGVDPELTIKALDRAAQLIQEIAGGEIGPMTLVEDRDLLLQSKTIVFDTALVEQLTGLSLSIETMQGLLESLGMKVSLQSPTQFIVQTPTYRFDLNYSVDLVEEIIRLYGYERLEAQPSKGLLKAGTVCAEDQLCEKLTTWFAARGFHETINYSFVNQHMQSRLFPNKEAIALVNPISSDLSQMRLSLWPGLIQTMVYNLRRQQTAIQLFETGVVFDSTERAVVAAIMTGEVGGLSWAEPTRRYDFYDMKGLLEALFSSLSLQDVAFVKATHEALHPSKSAQIQIANQMAGWIGVLDPRITDSLDVQGEVIVFELALASMMQIPVPRYQKISKYPQIRRDLSFLLSDQIEAKEIEALVRQTLKTDWLKAFYVFDIYRGKGIPMGMQSMAIALILQEDNRTLVDAEINQLITAIITALEEKFAIQIRN